MSFSTKLKKSHHIQEKTHHITLQNLTPYRLQFFEIDFQGGANFSLAVMNS